MTKALVVGSGAMYGAYSAGVFAELGRVLGPEYFGSIYASSAGVFAGTFYAAGQPHVLEETWRRHIDGRKFINPFRFWNVLKLNYLVRILQDERALLDVDALFQSRVRLTFVLTRLRDGRAVYQEPVRENVFNCMKASSAIPLLHPAVQVGNELFLDGAFSDPLPVARALEDGARFVVAVSNKHADFQMPGSFFALGMACKFKSKIVSRLVYGYKALLRAAEETLRDPRVLVIRPSEPLPLRSSIDTDLVRLNATIDLGIKDARLALKLLLR